LRRRRSGGQADLHGVRPPLRGDLHSPPRGDRRRGRRRQGKDLRMGSVPLAHYLALAAALFSIGLAAVLIRRNALVLFMGVELMLNAGNLTFLAFSRNLGLMSGHAIAFF